MDIQFFITQFHPARSIDGVDSYLSPVPSALNLQNSASDGFWRFHILSSYQNHLEVIFI